MKKTSLLIALLFGLVSGMLSQEAPEEKAKRMEWFKDAKLGIWHLCRQWH